jgi:hypothetical protein
MDVKAMLWAASVVAFMWSAVGTYIWAQGVRHGVDVKSLQGALALGFSIFAFLAILAAGWPS